jgi:hypothetical protein
VAASAEAASAQRELVGLDGIRPTPAHWLHVSLGHGREDQFETVRERLRRFGSFEADYGPTSCFHEAVVLEVHSERFENLARAVDPDREVSLFLPHLSIAYVDGSPAAAPIRERVNALRARPPVRDLVSEIELCVIPVARGQLLSPWRVVGTVPL